MVRKHTTASGTPSGTSVLPDGREQPAFVFPIGFRRREGTNVVDAQNVPTPQSTSDRERNNSAWPIPSSNPVPESTSSSLALVSPPECNGPVSLSDPSGADFICYTDGNVTGSGDRLLSNNSQPTSMGDHAPTSPHAQAPSIPSVSVEHENLIHLHSPTESYADREFHGAHTSSPQHDASASCSNPAPEDG